MRYRLLAGLTGLAVLLIGGCVSVPTDPLTGPVTADELSQHVEFLTQRALKGRPAGARRSAHVRDYLSQRLSEYGCVPWADNDTFVLDFGFGKNVIGLLPGSDPALADQIVLISAHYDHLRPGLFRWYPGACDNAAAVAVLLEIAETVSRRNPRPRRPICFAFFDAEEMGCVGSYAFTGRDDYDDGKIAATLNMDMLGRDLLDVVADCLIATGTDRFGPLQQRIGDACADNGLRFVPLESDLIGPVGDHTAFVSGDRPTLFFTCGINRDYHQPTDTPDKLNFAKLRKESAVIERTLLDLADGDAALLSRSDSSVTPQRVEAFGYLLDQFKQNRDVFELDPNGIQTLDTLLDQVRQVGPNTMTRADLIHLERQALAKLISLLKNYNPTLSQFSEAFVQISEYYAINPAAFTRIYRQMVQHYLDHKPSLFSRNKYHYRDVLPVNENSWGLTALDDGDYLFGFIDLEVSFESELLLLSNSTFSCGIHGKMTACRGTLPDIARFAFWGTIQDPNAFRAEIIGLSSDDDNVPDKACTPEQLNRRRRSLMTAFAQTVSQQIPEGVQLPVVRQLYDPNNYWVDPNDLADRSLISDPNKPFGTVNCFRLFFDGHERTSAQKETRTTIAYAIARVSDSSQHPNVRADWISYLAGQKNRAALEAVADLIDDTTPYKPEKTLMGDPRYPLKYHPVIKQYLAMKKETVKKYEDKTLGRIALQALRNTTKQDFGTDKEAWKDWIAERYD